MNREQAEKKARELLGGKLKLSGRLGNSQDYANNYYNQAIDKAIPIVADLLMREAELEEVIFTETHYKQSYKASQKRVEELEKLSSIRSEGIDNITRHYCASGYCVALPKAIKEHLMGKGASNR